MGLALDEDLARLEVAVKDPVGVGCLERGRDRRQGRERATRLEAIGSPKLIQAPTPNEVHGEIEPLLGPAAFIDRDYVWMKQIGGLCDLLAEALAEVGAVAEVAAEQLERDTRRPVEPRVASYTLPAPAPSSRIPTTSKSAKIAPLVTIARER